MSLSLARKRRNRDANGVVGDSQIEQDVPSKRRNCNPSDKASSQYNLNSQSQRLNASGFGDTRRCGKLLRMHLTNFMCHSNLSIDFHSRVNFLVGSNGSGKSAILAALVLGLGGSAKTTNRSRSAKAFVKTGETSAKIEIVISNDGPQPYEPEVYGDRITVLRTISMSSSSYVIKDSHGRVVTKKLDDLHRLLMYHNIQVDNPVFVLNQDSAREFLKDLEPSKNYTLFLKATQIDIVMEKLHDSLHLHKSHINEIENFKIKLEKEAEDIKEHKDKLEELLSFEKLKDVLFRTEIEHDWLLVKECEDKLHELDEKLEKYEKKEREIQHSIQNKSEVNILLNQEIKKNEAEVAAKNRDYDKENKEYREIKSKYEEINILATDIVSAQDSLKKKKSSLEKQVEEIRQYIKERSEGNQDDVDAQRLQNQNAVKVYRDQCENQFDPMIANLKRELELHINSKTQKELVVNEIKRRQRDYLDEIRLKNGQIATVKASVNNKLLIYGDHMPQLLSDIRKAHSQGIFSKMPRGPIGSYVEVPNSEYRDAVETVIGAGLLGAFLVNNTKDRKELEKIIAKHNQKRPVIITTAFTDRVHNVSDGCVQPPSGTRLLMQEVKCADPVVLNSLIDRVQIESILLTNDKDIAESITSTQKNVPNNLTKVIVLKEGNLALEYFPVPKYRMYSTRIKQASYIQVNVDERIRHLQTEKLSLENKCKDLEDDLNYIGQQIPQDTKQIYEKRKLLDKHESTKKEILEKIAELENIEYIDYSNETNLLKKEMEETEARLATIQKKLEDKRAELTEANNKKSQLEDELKSKERVLQEMRNEIETYQSKSDQIKMKLRSINSNDSTNRSKLSEIQDIINRLNSDKQDITSKLERYTATASEKGERLDTKLSLNEIQDKISKIKAKLRHGKPVSLDPQSMRELIETKEEAMEVSQGNFDNIKRSIQLLRKSLKFRFEFLKKLKEHMALLLQLSFSMILKLRNFEGSLDVNHQEKTLKISVIPRDHNKNAVSNTKSLSGGERSYSTVAFLISLWSCVDHPFYFLDEYDVFTDEVNREYMTRLLVDEGRKRPLRQYAFLTPQDMALMSEDFIKILRLGEPDRR